MIAPRPPLAVGDRSLTLQLPGGPVPLGFVRDGSEVFLVARDRSSRWPTTVLRAATVEITVGEERLFGRARLEPPGPGRESILARFREKYGPADYARWYDHPARVLILELGASAPPVTESGRYYGWLESEFDNIAAEYDHHILSNRMNRLLRDRSLARLVPTFRGSPRLLEIGCGSGLETLRLLEAGHEVTAVDISSAMLDVVRGKARQAGLSERLQTICSPAGRLMDGPDAPPPDFDGGYSTYGAINCEPRLDPFREAFARALRPGSPLVLGVYNRWCAAELLGYGLTLQWERAGGRRRNPIPVGASRFCVDVYAYSPGDVRRAFTGPFQMRGTSAVPLILPPSDLTAYAEKFARHFETLERWDRWLGDRATLSGLGDHFLMTLERTRSAG